MALPQTIDPASLNLSGTPAIATAPTTTTSAGATGMPMPRVAMEKNEVPLGAGALLGYALGNLMGNKGTALTGNRPTQNTNQPTDPNKPSGPSGPSGGTPTGNIGSVNNVKVPSSVSISEAQNWLNTNYGMTNGQPNYVVSGTNMSTGEVIGLPNDKIGGTNLGTNTGNFGFEAGTGSGGTTGGTTQTSNQYFQDSVGNVYDADGTLIYYNPSNVISGGTMDGGGYDPNEDTGSDLGGFFQNSAGDIYDSTGSLVLEYGNGYYYEPDTGNYYDSNFDVVDDSFSFFRDFMGLPAFDSSEYDDFDFSDLFDYGNYTSGSTTYIKDGGSVRGGLATPLFRNGGSVPRFADGGTSFTDQVVANQMPQSVSTASTPVTTQTNLTNPVSTTGTSQTGVINTISNLLGNSGVSGALLGTLIAQMLNSTEQPVNKGVDMTALGTLRPRTTPTGPARFVPYSEYGTPTTPYDYSQLYANLGISPFGAGTGALSPSATPTSSVTAQPVTVPTAPTAPIGGLPTSTTPTITPPTASAPQYFQDADGNVYNANGDLVYDTTTGTTTPTAKQAVAPSGTTQPSVAPMSGLAVTTPEASSSYYSYGSNVDPAQVLSSKKGGTIRKFADGGMSDLAVTSLSDAIEAPAFDYSDRKFDPDSGVMYDDETKIATDAYGHTMDISDFVDIYGLHPTYFDKTPTAMETTSAPPSYEGKSYDELIASGVHPMNAAAMTGRPMPVYDSPPPIPSTPTPSTPRVPLPYERTITSTGTNSPELDYILGMPKQGSAMPTQGGLMPTQGPAMPTQGSLMPPQTPFSSSPTFRFSGANNPFLTGLSRGPVPQPYTPSSSIYGYRGSYAEGGSPHGNANIPVTEGHNPNVPIVQGRQDYREGAYVQGEGDGQSDDIPAMLADGEYVIDAETVAQLGNGSNKAGAKMLDTFRENIRAHKRSAPTHKIPPKSKSPLAYLKGAK